MPLFAYVFTDRREASRFARTVRRPSQFDWGCVDLDQTGEASDVDALPRTVRLRGLTVTSDAGRRFALGALVRSRTVCRVEAT